jgi:alanine dehydrogenase
MNVNCVWTHEPFRRIGLAAEHASPENPDGSETRVALTPAGVMTLVENGCRVAVECDAGSAIGFPDSAYRAAGATIESRDNIYRQKDLVIKIKGPSHKDLWKMDVGSTLFCMAHVQSIPARVKVANERGVNILAMELISELSPLADSYIRSQLAMERIVKTAPCVEPDELDITFVGFSSLAFGAIQYAARCRPRSLRLSYSWPPMGTACSKHPMIAVGLSSSHRTSEVHVLDDIASEISLSDIEAHRAGHPGGTKRRIQCLHETGRAGARFGIDLVIKQGRVVRAPAEIRVAVMGYGNVAFGALDECIRHGIGNIEILTERTTRRPGVLRHLRSSDLIINGVEQAPHLRGKNYIVTTEDLSSVLRPGTVIIDLVGGSATNRTAIEPIVECTHPGDPYIIKDGVYLASVWGWPLMGFQKESVERYSRQIIRVLLFDERLINGLAVAPDNILQALVAGPVYSLIHSRR